MEWRTATGIGLFLIGIAGYSIGIYIPYPARGFSLTAIMVGIAVAMIAQQGDR